jgi:hypothetical protein
MYMLWTRFARPPTDGSHVRSRDEALFFSIDAIRWNQFSGIYFIVCNYRLLLLHWMSQDFIGDVMLRHMDVFVAFSFPSISRKLIRKAALFKSIFISSLVPFVYTMDFLNNRQSEITSKKFADVVFGCLLNH